MFDSLIISTEGRRPARPKLRWWWWCHFVVVTVSFLSIAAGPWLAALNAVTPTRFVGVSRVLAACALGGMLVSIGWACVVIPALESTFPVIPECDRDRRARFTIVEAQRLVFLMLVPPLLVGKFGSQFSDRAFWSVLIGGECLLGALWWWSGRWFARRAARTHATTEQRCTQCQYDLSGHQHQQCPECGATIPEPLQSQHADPQTPTTAHQPDRGRRGH